MPSPATKSWERSAKLVKKTDTSNQYLEHIRDMHDPSLQLKTLEDELKGTMGKALGRQGEKIHGILRLMAEEFMKYEQIMAKYNIANSFEDEKSIQDQQSSKLSESSKKEIYRIVQNHNRLRKKATDARWELLVHRQAVGFITNNHRFVNEMFPIPDLLDLPGGEKEKWEKYMSTDDAIVRKQQENVGKEAVTRNFGDQLDWWERIGRWR